MKKLSAITKITLSGFLAIILLALIISVPVFRRLEKVVDRYTNNLTSQLTEKTGLVLSYDSISPSVFASLGIKGIKLSNAQEGLLGEIKNTRVKYKLLPLLKGEYDSIIKGIVLDGVVLDIDAIVAFAQNFQKLPEKDRVDKPPEVSEILNIINTVIDFVPPYVTVKNLSLNYTKDLLNASLLVKEIRVLNSEHKDSVEFNAKTFANVLYGKKLSGTGDILLNGTVTKSLDNSFVYVNLANFTEGKYKFNKFNFLLSYNNKKIDIRSVQNVMPLSLEAYYDFALGQAEVKLITQNLSPLSIITNAAGQENLELFKEMSLTAQAGLSYKIKNKELSYSSNGNLYLPDSMLSGGAELTYDLSGDDKKLLVKRLSALGQNINVSSELSLPFKTLQLAGTIDLREFVLPNGRTISSEIYFDPLQKSGFMLFSPQIFLGDSALTALQARFMPQEDSIDFDLEVNDFSHIEEGTQGSLKADGSYMLSSNYIQTGVTLGTISLDSVLKLVSQFLPEKNAQSLQKAIPDFSDYVFSGDLYASTDLKSLSFNLPYLVLANTKKDNQLLLLSIDGNEQSIQLSRFNLIFGAFAMEATASLDSMPDSKDKFYTLDIISSSIPYHFTGTIMPEVVTVTGTYNTDAEIRFTGDGNLEGFALFKELPVIVAGKTFLISLDTLFDYTKLQGPQITLQHFQLEQNDPNVSINPRLELSGSATKYGAQINNISYTDLYSSLRGNSDLTVNLNEKILESAGIQMNLRDNLTEEAFVIDATVSNPDMVLLSKENVFNSLYVNAMIEASNFSLNRFMSVKNDNNALTASLYLSGTLEHPYATASIQRLNFLLNDEIIFGSGSVILEERNLSLNDFILEGTSWNVKDVSGELSISDYSGSLQATLSTKGEKNIIMPLVLSVEDSYRAEGEKLPESLTAKLSCPGLEGSLLKKPIPFDLYLNYTKDFLSFYSSDNLGIMGTFSPSEGLYASWNMKELLSTEISGSFSNKASSYIKFSNINIELSRLLNNLTFDDFIKINQGLLKGSVTIRTPFDSPDFKGAVSVANPVLQLPFLFEQRLSTDKILVTASNNEFSVAESSYNLKNTPKFKMNARLYMNKWSMDRFDLKIATLENQFVPVKLKTPFMKLSADTECDFTMALENKNLDLQGTIFTENLDVISDIADLTRLRGEESNSPSSDISVTTDLNLNIGTHGVLNFNPLLRCVFVPHTSIKCRIDSASNSYQLDGSLDLKSGDVAYLNRNFYIKEGSIKFNPLDIANPQVTIRAETREKDTSGQTIRIILSAENQYLLDFNPRFSSIPAKSESEIQLLLGQIVLADSESVGQFMVSAGEYYIQSTIIRNIENKLRDLMNFDIFSVRTNILQNTINLNSPRNKTKELTIGNFFDNSTVYIGKYIGSALYVDAMLNMSASDYRDTDYLSANSILFQPEFGLELELPVLNIRWDMAWNIVPGMAFQSFVPSTSVSLNWKFTF